MPESTDETIVIRWVVETADALTKHKELREAVITIREQLKQLSAESNASYKDMAKSMVSAFSDAKVEAALKNNPMLTMKEALQKVKPEVDMYKQAMSMALSSIRDEVTKTGALWNQATKDMTLQTQQNAQAVKQAQQAEAQATKLATQSKLADIKQQAVALQYLQQVGQQTSQSLQGSGGGTGGEGTGGFLGKIFGGMGALAGIAGQLIGITSALMALRKALQFLQESTQQAYEFQKAVFGMVVGIRALQRAGVNITMKEMVENLKDLREEFGVFSMVDLVQGSAAFLNLNRDMGFTKEQLFDLQKAIATLAVVNGRSMDEVQKTVALALSSGYTEGLQRLGVSINRVTIAQEAANLGWKGGYTSLNEQQRALATYNLIIRKTAIYQEDLLKYQETLPGRIDVATKAIQDNTVAIGNNTLALQLWWQQTKLFFLEHINMMMAAFSVTDYQDAWVENLEKTSGRGLSYIEEVAAKAEATSRFYAAMINAYNKGEAFDVQTLIEEIGLSDVEVADKRADEILSAEVAKLIEEKLDDINQIQEDYQEEYEKNWEEYRQDLIEIENDFWNDIAELEQEWERRIADIDLDYDRKKLDMETDFNRDMEKIRQDALQKAADAQTDYQNSVVDTWASYYSSVAGAQAKYQNQQIDAEIAFQERMRKLREGLLFDLEDALRARDARQVLQLLRRYQLEKTQAEREYEQQKDQMRRQFEEQMAELARQRDERLASLYRELQARLAAILIEQQREEEARRLKYEQEKADAQADWEQKRADNDTRYAQEINDRNAKWEQEKKDREAEYKRQQTELWNATQERYRILAEGIANELGLNADAMKTFYDQIYAVLGPGMGAESLYRYYSQMVASYMSSIPGMLAPVGPPLPGPNQAEGGTAYANTATQVTFGEAGPEMAIFLPLSKRMGDLGSALAGINLGGASVGNGPGGRSQVQVEVLLDPRLEGRIIDTALDNVADVIIRRLR